MTKHWQKIGIALVCALGALSLAACGGDSSDGSGTTGGGSDGSSGGSTAEISGPPQPWEQMSHQERSAYMAEYVVPTMQPLFEAYDEANGTHEFERFGCRTCHGPDMAERNFEMPNMHILALHPTGSDEQHAMVREHPQMVRFMFNQVVPNMQRLLGAEEFNVETQQGFSCYSCHPHAGQEGASHHEDEDGESDEHAEE